MDFVRTETKKTSTDGINRLWKKKKAACSPPPDKKSAADFLRQM